jgi:hypothetical protein
MQANNTRQRQGRDFSILERLRGEPQTKTAAESEREKKSALERLERFKAEAELGRIPTDGNEPPEMEGLTR